MNDINLDEADFIEVKETQIDEESNTLSSNIHNGKSNYNKNENYNESKLTILDNTNNKEEVSIINSKVSIYNYNNNNDRKSNINVNISMLSNKGNIIANPQPRYVLRKKNCCENYFPLINKFSNLEITKNNYLLKSCYESCIPISEKLTIEETTKFEKLCLLGMIEYDGENKNHEVVLLNLYQHVFSETLVINKNYNVTKEEQRDINDDYCDEKILINSNWRKIGFQSNNPRTDFRAGGLLSLKFIYFFVQNFSNDFEEMIKLDFFLFAVVAIKVSFYVRLFIGAYDCQKEKQYYTTLKINKLNECSRYQLKNFCRCLNTNSQAFYIITSKVLLAVKDYLMRLYNADQKEINFTFSDIAIMQGIEFLSDFLNIRIPNSEDFDSILDKMLEEL